VPSGGTRGATVGAPLIDREDRRHTHTVDPTPVMTSTAGAHVHDVNPIAATTGDSTDLAHAHAIDPPAHQHRWASYAPTATGNSAWRTYQANDTSANGQTLLVEWSDGLDNAGTGEYPLQEGGPATSTRIHYTQMTDQPSFASGGTTTSLRHSHAYDVGNTTSTSAGSHGHTCDVGSTLSTTASTGQVMPYLQLLVCRKN
jgi:hypothetical protein